MSCTATSEALSASAIASIEPNVLMSSFAVALPTPGMPKPARTLSAGVSFLASSMALKSLSVFFSRPKSLFSMSSSLLSLSSKTSAISLMYFSSVSFLMYSVPNPFISMQSRDTKLTMRLTSVPGHMRFTHLRSTPPSSLTSLCPQTGQFSGIL